MGGFEPLAHTLEGFAAHGGVERLVRSGFQVDVVNRVANRERGVRRASRVDFGAAVDAQADTGMSVDKIQYVFFFQETGFPVDGDLPIMPQFSEIYANNRRRRNCR